MKDKEVFAKIIAEKPEGAYIFQALPVAVQKQLFELLWTATLLRGTRRAERFFEATYKQLRNEPASYSIPEILATEITEDEYPAVRNNFASLMRQYFVDLIARHPETRSAFGEYQLVILAMEAPNEA